MDSDGGSAKVPVGVAVVSSLVASVVGVCVGRWLYTPRASSPMQSTSSSSTLKPVSKTTTTSDDIAREQLARVEAMYMEEGLRKLRGAFVIVIGVSGFCVCVVCVCVDFCVLHHCSLEGWVRMLPLL
jgi:hypothetical protein